MLLDFSLSLDGRGLGEGDDAMLDGASLGADPLSRKGARGKRWHAAGRRSRLPDGT